MSFSFTDKVCLVTGSGGGLGKTIATRYLESGGKVVLCDINEELLKTTEEELTKLGTGTVFAHKVDITDEESVKTLFEAVVAKFGRIDVVVNNAGVTDKFGMLELICWMARDMMLILRTVDAVGTTDKSLWDKVFAVNVTGVFLISKYTVNQMTAQEPAGGAIVNIISVAGFRSFVAGKYLN
jgi:NAD(P)-dependent dehydrogenase (short-subunit alcohol dehydrogenase family)